MEDIDEAGLAAVIRQALALADELKLADVGISLDRALVLLTGRGVEPPPRETRH